MPPPGASSLSSLSPSHGLWKCSNTSTKWCSFRMAFLALVLGLSCLANLISINGLMPTRLLGWIHLIWIVRLVLVAAPTTTRLATSDVVVVVVVPLVAAICQNVFAATATKSWTSSASPPQCQTEDDALCNTSLVLTCNVSASCWILVSMATFALVCVWNQEGDKTNPEFEHVEEDRAIVMRQHVPYSPSSTSSGSICITTTTTITRRLGNTQQQQQHYEAMTHVPRVSNQMVMVGPNAELGATLNDSRTLSRHLPMVTAAESLQHNEQVLEIPNEQVLGMSPNLLLAVQPPNINNDEMDVTPECPEADHLIGCVPTAAETVAVAASSSRKATASQEPPAVMDHEESTNGQAAVATTASERIQCTDEAPEELAMALMEVESEDATKGAPHDPPLASMEVEIEELTTTALCPQPFSKIAEARHECTTVDADIMKVAAILVPETPCTEEKPETETPQMKLADETDAEVMFADCVTSPKSTVSCGVDGNRQGLPKTTGLSEEDPARQTPWIRLYESVTEEHPPIPEEYMISSSPLSCPEEPACFGDHFGSANHLFNREDCKPSPTRVLQEPLIPAEETECHATLDDEVELENTNDDMHTFFVGRKRLLKPHTRFNPYKRAKVASRVKAYSAPWFNKINP